ncbi:MAG: hypothetical protein JWO90_1098, partial [Solirubrobacterales bacterium]|nr:hypothetical protein [Solirubrobacterales bacterium]
LPAATTPAAAGVAARTSAVADVLRTRGR